MPTSSEIYELLVDQWGLDPPRTVLSVIGSSDSLELPPDHNKMLLDTFEIAADSGVTWFLTDGWSTGVSGLVGEGIERSRSQRSVVISVNYWQDLDSRPWSEPGEAEKQDPVGGGIVVVAKDNGKCTASGETRRLDHNHSHYIFLPGRESVKKDPKFDLEQYMSNINNVVSFGRFCTESPVSHKHSATATLKARAYSITNAYCNCDSYSKVTSITVVISGEEPILDQIFKRVFFGGDKYNADVDRSYEMHKQQVLVIFGTGGVADVVGYEYKR